MSCWSILSSIIFITHVVSSKLFLQLWVVTHLTQQLKSVENHRYDVFLNNTVRETQNIRAREYRLLRYLKNNTSMNKQLD